jgi:hypothetical protein
MAEEKVQNTDTSYGTGHWANVHKDFEKAFGVSIRQFYDGLTTLFLGKICINPFVFDDYLHRIHGDYEGKGLSMEDLITQEYGEEALKVFNKLI